MVAAMAAYYYMAIPLRLLRWREPCKRKPFPEDLSLIFIS